MKQTVFAKFFCAALAAALLAACAAQPQSASQAQSAPPAQSVSQTAAPGALRYTQGESGLPTSMALDGDCVYMAMTRYCDAQPGDRYTAYQLLLCMDLKTRAIRPVCDVDGCTHTTSDCPAWQPDGKSLGVILNNVRTTTERAEGSALAVNIERQPLDGMSARRTVRTVLACGELSASSDLLPGVYTDGASLYYPDMIDCTQQRVVWRIVRMALDDGAAVEAVAEFDGALPQPFNAGLMPTGVLTADGEMVFAETSFDTAAGGNVLAYHAVGTDGSHRLLWAPQQNADPMAACGGLLLAFDESTGAPIAFDLATEEIRALRALPLDEGERAYGFDGRIIDGRLILRREITGADGMRREDAMEVPLDGGEAKPLELTLTTRGPETAAAPAPGTDDSLTVLGETPYGLLVAPEIKAGPDGSQRPCYALMDADDYFANRAVYRPFTWWDEV